MTTYYATAIIEGVTWLTEDDKSALNEILPHGRMQLEEGIPQLHLAWPFTSATLDEAITSARLTLRKALKATSVSCPVPSAFEVRRCDEERSTDKEGHPSHGTVQASLRHN